MCEGPAGRGAPAVPGGCVSGCAPVADARHSVASSVTFPRLRHQPALWAHAAPSPGRRRPGRGGRPSASRSCSGPAALPQRPSRRLSPHCPQGAAWSRPPALGCVVASQWFPGHRSLLPGALPAGALCPAARCPAPALLGWAQSPSGAAGLPKSARSAPVQGSRRHEARGAAPEARVHLACGGLSAPRRLLPRLGLDVSRSRVSHSCSPGATSASRWPSQGRV